MPPRRDYPDRGGGGGGPRGGGGGGGGYDARGGGGGGGGRSGRDASGGDLEGKEKDKELEMIRKQYLVRVLPMQFEDLAVFMCACVCDSTCCCASLHLCRARPTPRRRS